MASREIVADLQAIIGIDTQGFRSGIGQVKSDLASLSDDGLLRGVRDMSRNLTFLLSAPFALASVSAIQEAAAFDGAMRNIASIVSLTEEKFQDLSDEVLNFGKNTREGATVAAESLYTVLSAGITDVGEAFNIMEVSTRTAEAGLSDMKVTTEALIQTMLAYSSQNVSIERTSDNLTRMVQIGVGSMESFAHSLSYVVPTASALGIEIEDLFGNLAYLTQRGMSASTSATSLNAALTSLMKPSEDLEAIYTELGVASGDELIAKFGGLEGALLAITDKTDGSASSLAKLFTTVRGMRAVNTFVNDVELWTETLSTFNAEVDGSTTRALEEQMKSLAYAFDSFGSAVQAVQIFLGRLFTDEVRNATLAVTDMLLGVTEMDEVLVKQIITWTGLALAIPPVVFILSMLAGVLFSVQSVIGLAIAGLVGLALNFETFYAYLSDKIPNLENMFDDLGKAFQRFASTFSDEITTIKNLWGQLMGALNFNDSPFDRSDIEFTKISVSPSDLIEIEIKPGDTLSSIWANHSELKSMFSDMDSFLEATGLDAPYIIRAGDILQIGDEGGGNSWMSTTLSKMLEMDQEETTGQLRPKFTEIFTGIFNEIVSLAQKILTSPETYAMISTFVGTLADIIITHIPVLIDGITELLQDSDVLLGGLAGIATSFILGVFMRVIQELTIAIPGLIEGLYKNLASFFVPRDIYSIIFGEDEGWAHGFFDFFTGAESGFDLSPYYLDFETFNTRFRAATDEFGTTTNLLGTLAKGGIANLIGGFLGREEKPFDLRRDFFSLFNNVQADDSFIPETYGEGLFFQALSPILESEIGQLEIDLEAWAELKASTIPSPSEIFMEKWLELWNSEGVSSARGYVGSITDSLSGLGNIPGASLFSGRRKSRPERGDGQDRRGPVGQENNFLMMLITDEQQSEFIEKLEAYATEWVEVILTTFRENLVGSDDSESGGLSKIMEELMLLIETYMGEEGILTIAFTNFTTLVSTQFVTLAGKFYTLRDSIVDTFNTMKEAISVSVKQMVSDLEKLSGKLQNIADVLSRMPSGFAGLPSIGLEHRAIGGNVSTGNPYIVGENGPELFIPNSSGRISRDIGGVTEQQTVIHQTTVNVYQATDTDKLLKELRRQGIVL